MSTAPHRPDPTIAVAQFAPGADVDANLAEIGALAREAAALGADLVVFPEYSSFFAPTMDERYLDAAQPLDGPFVAGLAELAAELDVVVVAGIVEQIAGERLFHNTVVAVGPDRSILARYRKEHLYDAFGGRESEWIRPGASEEPQLLELAGLRIGMQTCYDIRFPEVTRRLVDAGADVVLVPAEWVRGPLKEQHWRTLLTARAIENTVYLAAADHTPPVGVGHSVVIDPMGVQVAGIGEERGIALARVSAARIESVRTLNPALRLRRYRVVAAD